MGVELLGWVWSDVVRSRVSCSEIKERNRKEQEEKKKKKAAAAAAASKSVKAPAAGKKK